MYVGREGWEVNHKRVERIWRQEGLKVPRRQPKRGRLWLNDGSCIRLRPLHKNHVWSYDFVSTRTHDGRALKLLTVLDEYTRRCLAIRVGRRTRSDDVLEVLTDLFARHGPPEHLRSDNGPEFTAKLVRRWLARLRVQTLYIAPGSPWENGYNESFNGKLRNEFFERRDLLHTARGRRTRRAVAAGVQYRSTPQRLRRSTPRSGSIETITLVPQNASAPGTANGFRSNIASGTAGGGTSPLSRRFIATLLLVLVTACHSWQPATVSPRQLIVEEEESPIRVILSDGTELTLGDPTIQSDSIITGRVRFGTENLLARDVSRIEVQRFSPLRTVGVVAVLAAIALFVPYFDSDFGR